MKNSPLLFFTPSVSKEQIIHKLGLLTDHFVEPIRHDLERLLESNKPITDEEVKQVIKAVYQVEELIRPRHEDYFSQTLLRHKRVLFAETNKRHQNIAKMALMGSGMELDVVSTVEQGIDCLTDNHYDVMCANIDLIHLVERALQIKPEIKLVLLTTNTVADYYPLMIKFPAVANIITRSEQDRTYYLKSIQSTVHKLITGDIFGLEKYLDPHVDIHHFPITHSTQRADLIEKMSQYLTGLGVRKKYQTRIRLVAEETLMNAIYDAPTDEDGQPRYNKYSRKIPIELKPDEQGVFSFACDGFLIAVAVTDPFGSFSKQTILKYLESCYTGNVGSLNKNKGGAGLGLYEVMEMSDFLVINVSVGHRTEVIAFFNIDPGYSKFSSSFHYFYT